MVIDEARSIRNSFETLLTPVLDGAYGLAMHMTRRREEAEDLVQEAVLQAFKAYAQFQQGTNFKAWFYQILINRFRYNYRKLRRAPQISVLDDAPDLYLYIQISSSGLTKGAEDPAALVLGRLTEEQIREALNALPEEFRIASALYFLEEMPYQEIACILECPVGTVRSRLHRGRKLLQKALWVIAQEHGIVNELVDEKTGGTRREKASAK